MTQEMQKKWWVLIGVGLASLLVSVDFTIVNTCLANIQRELGATVGQLQWVMSGFGLSFCALLATSGRLADILGRRRVLYVSVILFALTSLGAGMAQSPFELILFRFFQGIAGAAVFPAGTALVVDAFPNHQHGRALGIYSSLLGTGLAMGPVFGGLISTYLTWRWIFFINAPVVIVSLLICLPVVKESKLGTKTVIDWWGLLFLSSGLSALVFFVTQGPSIGWFTPFNQLAIAVFLVCTICFVLVERRVASPIIPFDALANAGFVLGTLIFMSSVSFSWYVIFIVPLYLHNVLGYNTLYVSLLLLPMTVIVAIAPMYFGHVFDRRGPVGITLVIYLFALMGLSLMLFFNTATPIWLLFLAFFLFGVSWGGANGIGMPVAVSKLTDKSNTGVINGASLTILNILGVLALTIGGAVFRVAEAAKLGTLIRQLPVHLSDTQVGMVRALLSEPEKLHSLSQWFSQGTLAEIVQNFRVAFVEGFRYSIAFAWVSILLIFIAALWIMYRYFRKS